MAASDMVVNHPSIHPHPSVNQNIATPLYLTLSDVKSKKQSCEQPFCFPSCDMNCY